MLCARPGSNGYVYLELSDKFAYNLYYAIDKRYDFKLPTSITNRVPGKAGEIEIFRIC